MDHLRIEHALEQLEAVRQAWLEGGQVHVADQAREVVEFVRECAQIAQVHVDVDVAITWTCGGCGQLQAVGLGAHGQGRMEEMRCPACGHISGDFFVDYRTGR